MPEVDDLTEFYLGDWRVDPVLKQISRGDELVRIDPRNMRVLLLLASQPGIVISQREIERVAWAGFATTPNSVYQSVAQLRRALGEDKTSRRYIETVSRRGYRLLAPVIPCTPPVQGVAETPTVDPVSPAPPLLVSPAAHPVRVGKSRRAWAIILGVTTLAVIALGFGVFRATVLPGSTNEATVSAARPAPDAPTSGSLIADIPAPLPENYQGDRNYRVSIQQLDQYVKTQSANAGDTDPSLLPALIGLGNLYPLTSDPQRCEQVTRRGLAILRKHGREPSTESVELNATLAEALADTRRYVESEDLLNLALRQARVVHGELHYATVAVIHQMALLKLASGQPVLAEQQARAAIEAYRQVPNATSTRAGLLRTTLVWALMDQARYQEAVTEAQFATRSIRPSDPPAPYLVALTHRALGEALVKVERYAEAETTLRRVLRLFATFPHCPMDTGRAQSWLGEALLRTGRAAEAAEFLKKAQRTLARGDGWRERISRLENDARLEQLRSTRHRPETLH